MSISRGNCYFEKTQNILESVQGCVVHSGTVRSPAEWPRSTCCILWTGSNAGKRWEGTKAMRFPIHEESINETYWGNFKSSLEVNKSMSHMPQCSCKALTCPNKLQSLGIPVEVVTKQIISIEKISAILQAFKRRLIFVPLTEHSGLLVGLLVTSSEETQNTKKTFDSVSSALKTYLQLAEAHYPERATSIQCLWNGVFTSRFIFRLALPASDKTFPFLLDSLKSVLDHCKGARKT